MRLASENYLELFEKILEECGLMDKPRQLYNMDEMGMPLEHRAPNIVTKQGKKKVHCRSTGNKAQITVVGCVNAVGNAIPPIVIYSTISFNGDWGKCVLFCI